MSHTFRYQFGDKLHEIRNQLGLSQRDVYLATGISQDTMRRLEGGLTVPRADTLEKLGELYHRNLFTLYGKLRKPILQFIKEALMRLDQHALHYDKDQIKALKEELEEAKAGLMEEDYPYIDQLIYLVEAQLLTFFGTSKVDFINGAIFLQKSFAETKPNFLFKDYQKYSYTPLELRLLRIYAINLYEKDKDIACIDVITFAISYMKTYYPGDELSRIYMSLLFTQSYFGFLFNNYALSLKCANEAIGLNIANQDLFGLGKLYYRKGIAEHFLCISTYKDSLRKAIQSLELSGQKELLGIIKDQLKSRYQIEL